MRGKKNRRMSSQFRLSTNEILAARVLNNSVDNRWVDWAVMMLERGYDTNHLRFLAGESPPYNQFELLEVADKTFEELGLDWSNTESVVNKYVAELLEEMLSGRKQSQAVLRMLKDMCIELDYADYLYDFYLLFFAQDDLSYMDHQHYWPDADPTNIENVIQNYARGWIKQHPQESSQQLT